MPAPTCPVLDNFNRADGAVGANWTQAVTTYSMPLIVSNALDWPQFPSMAWVTQFGANQEQKVKVVGVVTAVAFLIRFANLNSGAESGYVLRVSIDPPNLAELKVWTSGLASATLIEYTNGVTLGTDVYLCAQAEGSTIRLYGSSDGVNWSLRRSWDDATFNRPGYVGLFNQNNSVPSSLDDFGAGNLSGPTPVASLRRRSNGVSW